MRSSVRAGARPVLALLVIAHGLAHAVLPMRGWMDPARLALDFMPFILYAVAVLGFVSAGLGLIGVRPFTATIRPGLVLGSAYSMIAIGLMGQGGLWWGTTVDVALLVTGLAGLYRYLPEAQEPQRGFGHGVRLTLGLALTAYAACAVVFWPLHRAWGSSPAEYALTLPGDGPDRNPSMEIQHAVTVNAPPEAVWPWLLQLGQDRAGFYSYDWLERAFGVDVHNVGVIRPEWQERQAGERVRATQSAYLGGMFGRDLGWTINEVDPGRAIVLQHWGAFVLEPTADGHTRFIIRTRVGREELPVWVAALDMMAFELPHFIMERRMMLTIKSLAETKAGKVS